MKTRVHACTTRTVVWIDRRWASWPSFVVNEGFLTKHSFPIWQPLIFGAHSHFKSNNLFFYVVRANIFVITKRETFFMSEMCLFFFSSHCSLIFVVAIVISKPLISCSFSNSSLAFSLSHTLSLSLSIFISFSLSFSFNQFFPHTFFGIKFRDGEKAFNLFFMQIKASCYFSISFEKKIIKKIKL